MSRLASNFEALDATEPYDVCVIGSGIAGSVLGLRLTRAGLRVLLIESGVARSRWGLEPRTHDAAIELEGDADYSIAGGHRRVGGASNVWAGVCERFAPVDFAAPPYGRGASAWPLRYADLEPHYRAAEQLFRVRELAAPRGGTVRAQRPERADRTFAALLRRHGVDARGLAVATPGDGARRFNTARELLPEFVASRYGTLVSGVTATRLRTDRNGRVVGATCRAPDGASKTARAHTYIVAAGALETPRLLLLSRSQRFPRGLGNDHDRVGRGFNDHAVVTVHAALEERAAGWLAAPHPLHTEQFHQTFRRHGLGAIHPLFGQSARLGRLNGPPLLPAAPGAPALRRGTLAIACRVEIKPSDGNRLTLSPTAVDGFGDPCGRLIFNYSEDDLELIRRTRAWLGRWLDRFGARALAEARTGWAGNTIGTCRMGTDLRTSVCDATLRVHASPNLYLCGAETFPTGNAVPPALTVAALANRLADHVIARARWCARASARPPRRTPAPAAAAAIPLVRRRPQP